MIRAIILLVSCPAQATTSLPLGRLSQHFPAGAYRETHDGLGLEVEHDVGLAHVGGVLWNFTNSYDEQSIYFGGTLKRCEGSLDGLRGCLGLTGLADGYDAVSGPEVSPLGGVTFEVSQGRFGAVRGLRPARRRGHRRRLHGGPQTATRIPDGARVLTGTDESWSLLTAFGQPQPSSCRRARSVGHFEGWTAAHHQLGITAGASCAAAKP